MPKYPNLAAEIARRGVTVNQMAKAIGCKPRSMSQRLNGDVRLTLDEAMELRERFFADCEPLMLFETRKEVIDGAVKNQ